ncbi:DUF1129 domain-containing protein [Lacticaseibacillus sharpeae]|uniref:Membrane-associated protein n=1 Tax=Lacticaseibacillus sharpeae JCM 1186 = DSM 20505 TaxID=1291052 RepID=A0A0R1ZU77_9LACO|nr:DUF1129 family protein [Lacticaseibacillus sharpeae]KRM55643.1 hypothetical protein FC18_GL001148 [Lacticaseibacillus sharpeae JCM 1186 = DSM 20505]
MAKKQEAQPVVEVNLDEELPKLSNKNADYVFRLRKFLKEEGVDEARETEMLQELIPAILKDQAAGKPANTVYGSPSVLADKLINAPKQAPAAQPFWIETTDLAFSFLAIFSLIYGAMGLFAIWRHKTITQNSGGLLSLAIMSFVAAAAFTYYSRWAEKPKNDRPNGFLTAAVFFALIIVGSFFTTWLTGINTPITASMPWWGQFILAVVAYGAHFFMKRKYNLRNLFQAAGATPRPKK